MNVLKHYSPAIEERYESLVPMPGWRRIPVMVEREDGGFVSVEDYMKLNAAAQFGAVMAVCGYFSRMRGPDCYKVFADNDYVYIDDGIPCGYPAPNIVPFYAGSTPVPAVVSQNDADLRHNAACVQPAMRNADRYETLQSELATARLIIEEARAILENCTGGGYAGDTGVLWDSKRHELLDRLDSSAPVPQPASFREVAEVPTANMEGGYCCQCGHELCDDCVPLHPIPLPAAVPAAVAKARCNKCGGADYAPHELYCADHPDNTILSAGNEGGNDE